MRRLATLTAVGVAAAVATTGCSVRGLQSYHLPGGAAFGHTTYKVTLVFGDVTALQPQSSVRVDDVPVGDVDKISVTGDGVTTPFKAKIVVRIKKNVTLPANAIGMLEQTSLLGEKFIAIETPDGQQAAGALPKDGSAMISEGTLTQPDVEEVFSALSLLLNGGGLEQLQTINTELATALTGRETNFRGLLTQLDTLLGSLDRNRSAIVRALDSLDRLSKTLVTQKTTIATALTDIAPGLHVLANEEPDLSNLLSALSRLGRTATRVIHKTKANTVADLESLTPVLRRLSAAGTYLPHALEVLLDYPFPKNATHGIFGDYTGLMADVDLQKSIQTLTGLPLASNGSAKTPAHGGKSAPLSPSIPSLLPPTPTLPSLLDDLLGPSQPVPDQSENSDDGLLRLLLGGLS